MATQTQTPTESERTGKGKEKIQQLRELFADAPELGKTALDNVIHELTAQARKPHQCRWRAPAGPASALARSRVDHPRSVRAWWSERLRAFLRLIGAT